MALPRPASWFFQKGSLVRINHNSSAVYLVDTGPHNSTTPAYESFTHASIIGSAENPADIFAEPLGRLKFAKFRDMLGLR